MSAFKAKLKKVCKNCSDASIKVYERNVRRLYNLTQDGDTKEVPDSGKWLSGKKLKDAYEKLDLKIRRHLSVSAVKASRAYGDESEYWVTRMGKDSEAHDKQREKRQLTEKEKGKIPKKGYASLKKLASEFARRNKRFWTSKTSRGVYTYGIWVLLRLMGEVPLRNTAATLQLTDSGKNNVVVVPKKGNGKLIIRVHKSSKKIGAKEIGLSRALTMALRKYLKYRGDADHDFLLSSKSGNPVTKSALGKTLHRVTGEILGKAFGSRIIRILAAQDARGVLEEANKLADKMLHATKTQTLQYAKK